MPTSWTSGCCPTSTDAQESPSGGLPRCSETGRHRDGSGERRRLVRRRRRMSDTVLVTGGFGLVGSETVKRFAAAGRPVVATDLDMPANHKKARALPAGAEVRWADLTNAGEVDRLLSEVAPAAIVHLAAQLAPLMYRNAALGRKVNVDATATLVRAAEALPDPPRFVLASSAAVYGSYNPPGYTTPLRADTPPHPTEVYGAQKLEAENLVRASNLEWVVLRLGGVLSVEASA